MERARHPRGPLVALVVVVLVAAFFRFYGLAWDRGYLFHPDERRILLAANELKFPSNVLEFFSADSPLSPKFFAYGSLPIYLIRILSPLAPPTAFTVPLRDDSFVALGLLGRIISGLFDLGTIVLTFFLARRLYSSAVGLFAAALIALTVLHIQLSHYYAVDTLLTFFVVATMFFCARFAQTGRWADGIGAGILFGCAMATKIAAVPLIVPIIVATLRARETAREARLAFADGPVAGAVDPDPNAVAAGPAVLAPQGFKGWRTRAARVTLEWRDRIWAARRVLAKIFGISLAVFLVTQPYVILDPIRFFGQVGTEALVARGWLDYPYTRQFAGSIPFVYQIVQSSIWGMGLPLGLVTWGGTALFVWQWWRRREWWDGFVLSWALVYFATIGGQYAKYPRYLLPLTPFLFIMAGAAGLRFLSDLRSRAAISRDLLSRSALWALRVGNVIVFALTLVFATAFLSIYTREHPWLVFSSWIYRNLPEGASIAAEHWDDTLPEPLNLDGRVRLPTEYKIKVLPMYDPDTPEKVDTIVETLSSSDYVLLASQRLYATIPRLPARYPISSRYYRLLFEGRLGFDLVAFARDDMTLDGVAIVDDTFKDAGLTVPGPLVPYLSGPGIWNWGRADESFTVYDHPMPLLFKKTRVFGPAELKALLTAP